MFLSCSPRLWLSVVRQAARGVLRDQRSLQPGQGKVPDLGLRVQPVQAASVCWTCKMINKSSSINRLLFIKCTVAGPDTARANRIFNVTYTLFQSGTLL